MWGPEKKIRGGGEGWEKSCWKQVHKIKLREGGRARLHKFTLKWKKTKERNEIKGIQSSSICKLMRRVNNSIVPGQESPHDHCRSRPICLPLAPIKKGTEGSWEYTRMVLTHGQVRDRLRPSQVTGSAIRLGPIVRPFTDGFGEVWEVEPEEKVPDGSRKPKRLVSKPWKQLKVMR